MESSFQKKQCDKHAYQNSSSREITNRQNKIRQYIQLDPDLEFIPQHKEIVDVLLKINKSEFLTIEGVLQKNQIDLSKIEICPKIQQNRIRAVPVTVNQSMSPRESSLTIFSPRSASWKIRLTDLT